VNHCATKGGPALKRLTALIAIALIALAMSGCDELTQQFAQPTPEPTPEAAEATPTPQPTPEPTPKPTPVPVVEIGDYAYERVSNKALAVSFMYPSHWINKPGTITISYVQPADEGAIAARVAVSVKKTGKELDVNGAKKELEKLAEKISGGLEDFKGGAISKKIKFMGGTGISMYYEAALDGQPVKGYVITTFKKSKKRLIALHFYAPADAFDDFAPVIKKIQTSVKLL
jgi:hypothetical protein